jgi:hypothetical protein
VNRPEASVVTHRLESRKRHTSEAARKLPGSVALRMLKSRGVKIQEFELI